VELSLPADEAAGAGLETVADGSDVSAETLCDAASLDAAAGSLEIMPEAEAEAEGYAPLVEAEDEVAAAAAAVGTWTFDAVTR
jgi:hypothetical protein